MRPSTLLTYRAEVDDVITWRGTRDAWSILGECLQSVEVLTHLGIINRLPMLFLDCFVKVVVYHGVESGFVEVVVVVTSRLGASSLQLQGSLGHRITALNLRFALPHASVKKRELGKVTNTDALLDTWSRVYFQVIAETGLEWVDSWRPPASIKRCLG